MIIADFSQIIIATLFVDLGKHLNAVVDESMLRHMILNSLRSNRSKFKGEFGELVLTFDSRQSWRKKIFPYYKASRAQDRKESEMDWDALYKHIDKIKSELREFFPYKCIEVNGAEADDVIGTLVQHHGVDLIGGEPILILSGDKDFAQLQRYANVRQWDPPGKRWIETGDPDKFLFTHICKGDKGDGVPNIRMNNNFFMIRTKGDRQKPISQVSLDEWYQDKTKIPVDLRERFEENRVLIDLRNTPEEIRTEVLKQYDDYVPAKRSGLLNYFMEHRLRLLIDNIGDF